MSDFETIGGANYQQSPGFFSKLRERLPFGSRGFATGLDFGSREMRVAVLQNHPGLPNQAGGLRLVSTACSDTPSEASIEGRLADGPVAAEALKAFFQRNGLKSSRVAFASLGDQTYCGFARVESHGSVADSLGDLVRRAVEGEVSYSFDSAYCDFEILDSSFETGQKSLIWGCAPANQVEWMRETVHLAGLGAAVADLRACALANAYAYNDAPSADEVTVLLEVAQDILTMVLTRGGVPLAARSRRVGRRWFDASNHAENERLRSTAEEFWRLLADRAGPLAVSRLVCAGLGAADEATSDGLCIITGLDPEPFDPFKRVESALEIEGDRSMFAVAVGLALIVVPGL